MLFCLQYLKVLAAMIGVVAVAGCATSETVDVSLPSSQLPAASAAGGGDPIPIRELAIQAASQGDVVFTLRKSPRFGPSTNRTYRWKKSLSEHIATLLKDDFDLQEEAPHRLFVRVTYDWQKRTPDVNCFNRRAQLVSKLDVRIFSRVTTNKNESYEGIAKQRGCRLEVSLISGEDMEIMLEDALTRALKKFQSEAPKLFGTAGS